MKHHQKQNCRRNFRTLPECKKQAKFSLVEEDINFILLDNNVTKICNSRTKVLVVMELALLVVMVAVEMIFSLDLSSKLVVLDRIAETKLCQT